MLMSYMGNGCRELNSVERVLFLVAAARCWDVLKEENSFETLGITTL